MSRRFHQNPYAKSLRIEPLEDRQLLSVSVYCETYSDLDRDGVYGGLDGEYCAGAVVEIHSSSDGIIGNADDALLASGTSYSSSGWNSGWLPEGLNYYIKVIAPTGYAIAAQKSAYNDVDVDGTTALFTISDGQSAHRAVLLVGTSLNWTFQAGSTTGSSCGNAVVSDLAGNAYVTGYFSGAVDFDPGQGQSVLTSANKHAYVAKYSPDGALVWATDLSPLAATNGIDVAVDASGTLYVTGSFSSGAGGGGGFFVSKLTSSGTAVWTKTVSLPGFQSDVDSRDNVSAITLGYRGVTVSGCFSGTVDFNPGSGTSNLTSAGDQDVFVLTLNTNGDFVWAQQTGGSGCDTALDVAIGRQGVYVTGTSGSNCLVANFDYYSGSLLWTANTSGTGTAIGTAITSTADYGIVVAGYLQGTVDFDLDTSVFNLTAAPNGSYSVFTLSLGYGSANQIGEFNWATALADSLVTPYVDVHALCDGSIAVAYSSTQHVYPDATDCTSSYHIGRLWRANGSPTWTTAPVYSLPSSTSWLPAGYCAGGMDIREDWTVRITGGFAGTAIFGYPSQSLTSLGTQDTFLAQYCPFIGAGMVTNTQLNGSAVRDNQQPAGTLIGSLSASSPLGSNLQYSLVPSGLYEHDDNACFFIDGDELRTTALYSYAGKDSYSIRMRAMDEYGQWTISGMSIVAIDHAGPKVTINRADDQPDPAAASPIHFTVVFGEPTIDFAADDVTISGTAPGTLEVTVASVGYSGTTYDVVVRGLSGAGTVVASIAAGVTRDRSDNLSLASTSTDNSVLYADTAPFKDLGTRGLPGVGFGASVWGDYDNDGWLDVAMAGHSTLTDIGYPDITRVYHNDGNGSFHDISAGLLPVMGGAMAWGDYDNDGRLDILLTGEHVDTTDPINIIRTFITKLYHNDGNGVFREVSTVLPGVSGGSVVNSSVTWGDYDNDGRLDILLAGNAVIGDRSVQIARIYHNDGNGVFHDISAGLPTDRVSSAAWGDYDNDGRLDLVLDTYDDSAIHCVRLYHNDGNGIFRDVSTSLGTAGAQTSSPTLGDFDNDGQLDILLSMNDGDTWHAVICRNDGNGLFHTVSTELPAAAWLNIAWGDYDKDGRLDILLNSPTGAKVYHNDGDGSFTDLAINLPGTYEGTAQWGDYNKDGRLDILLCGMDNQLMPYTRIYENNVPPAGSQAANAEADRDTQSSFAASALASADDDTSIDANTPPAAPTNLQVQTLSPTSVRLSWNAATDAETPSGGLSYALRVGTTPGGCDIVNPMADADGLRRLAEHGTIQGTSWTVTGLTSGRTYYWSVQAVDTSFCGSALATERNFAIGAAPLSIGQVTVVPTRGIMSWNVLTSDGAAGCSLTVDGTAVPKVYGPYAAASGVNFSGVFGNLSVGSHSYTITATGRLGNSTQYTGSFDVTPNTAPAISGVAVVPAQGVMSWNALDSDGIASASLTVDGASVSKIYGPYAAASGANYAGVFGNLASGAHAYAITVTDNRGGSSQYTGSFEVAPNAGPTISAVAVVPTQGLMSWNALDSDGVASASLTVDGTAVSNVYGPYAAASGVNYAGVFGNLASGAHAYIITVTDNRGGSTQYTGSFQVAPNAGPTISGVAVVPAQGLMSWNALDSDGVASVSLAVDGTAVSKVYGPYAAASGVNYAGVFGTLAAGPHAYTITATDNRGGSSQYTGSFEVAANVGPTISGVVTVTARGLMSWNVLDSDGVAGCSLTVDGTAVSKVYGPYAAASGVNYSGVFGTLSAGTHNYSITATDNLGKSSQYTNTFSVAALTVAASTAAQGVPELLFDEQLAPVFPTLSTETGGTDGVVGNRFVHTGALDHVFASLQSRGRKSIWV